MTSVLREKRRDGGVLFHKIMSRVVENVFFHYIFDVFFTSRLVSKKIKKILFEVMVIDDLISTKNVEKIVLTTDRTVGIELSAAITAHKRGLDVVVASFAISADVTSSEKLRKSKLYFYEKSDSWNTAILPNGKRISFFKKHDKKVIELLKVKISNPWVLGAGFSDYMLVDSEREKQRLVHLGGERGKYFVTGQMSHDQLFNTNKDRADIKRRYLLKYGLSDKKIILIAVPQYYEHGLCDRGKHFYFLSEMIEVLSNLDCNVILSLHPKMIRSDYEKFLRLNTNITIADESLSNILPVCDLFVSTYSSTVAWGLLCNKKIVIVDHIGLGYKDFFSEFRIPITRDNKELIDLVTEIMLSDINAHYDVDMLNYLSPFDGLCSERIVKFLSESKNE